MKHIGIGYTGFPKVLLKAVLVTSGVMISACSEDIVDSLFHDGTPIKVSASFEKMNIPFTRAISYDAINYDGFTVSSQEALRKVLVRLNDGEHDYGDQIYTIQGLPGEVSTTIAQSNNLYFYETKTSVDVWARYPNTNNITTDNNKTYFTVSADQYNDVNEYQKSDLLLTPKVQCSRSRQSDGTYDVTEARLNFKHQMAKLVINARTVETAGESYHDLKIKSIIVKGVKPTIEITPTFDVDGNPVLGEAQGTATDFTLFSNSEGATTASGALLFPPQSFTHSSSTEDKLDFVMITISYINSLNESVEEVCEYYFKDGGKTFNSGSTYVMNIDVGVLDIGLKDEYEVPGVPLKQWQDNDELRVDISPAAKYVLLTTGEHGMDVTISEKTRTYTGNEIQLTASGDNPELTVVSRDATVGTLMYGRDYRLLYVNNVDAGTATAIVEGAGIYIGTLSATFPISKKNIADETITVDFSNTTMTYNTREHKPTPTVTDSEPTDPRRQSLLAYDYDITYSTGTITNAGTGTATLTGKGNYYGSRTETFTIGKAVGSVTYNEHNLSLVMPEGHPFYYITSYKVNGDGVPSSIRSSNTAVIDNIELLGNNKIKFRVKKEGSANVVMTLSGANYDYSNEAQNTTNTITITKGPKLPIEYVGEYDIRSFSGSGSNWTFAFAPKHESQYTCWLTTCKNTTVASGATGTANNGIPFRTLVKNGMQNVNGVNYHVPSTWEWRSIFPANSMIFWGRSYQRAMDTGVGFGVTVTNKGSRTTESNDAGYSYAMSKENTSSWQSDFYNDESNRHEYQSYYVGITPKYISQATDASLSDNMANSPNMTCYALRFKGTTYCSAWRYDWVWNDGSTYYSNLTKNTVNRKSMVVRVIYLGPTFEYQNEANWRNELVNLNWTNASGQTLGWGDYLNYDDSKVIIRRFPCVGARYYCDYKCEYDGQERNTDRYEMNWYFSSSILLEHTTNPTYQSVRITYPFAQGDQCHSDCSFPIRLFKDK